MPTVLVVDDSAKDRGLAGGLLAKDDNVITYANNGREALESVNADPPDLVITDLQMPEMNGLELVEAMRQEYPAIPIVLMTARGSEEIASQALVKGAAGYVPKITLGQNLRTTVRRVMADAAADRLHSRLMHSLAREEIIFELRNDPELINPLVAHIQESLRCLPLGDEAERIRVCVGLRQALWIAHIHGNLEVPMSADVDDPEVERLVTARIREEPYCDRTMKVRAAISRDEALFTIHYDGPRIAVEHLPENLHEEAADNAWLGRFVVVASVMDDVSYETEEPTLQLLKKAVEMEADLEVG